MFAVLALSAPDGTVAISTRLLAHRASISKTQAHRALRKLRALGLITKIGEESRGIAVWKLAAEFSTDDCPPSPLKNPPTRSFNLSSPETTATPSGAAWSEFPIKSKSKALRWAMSQLRREIQRWGLPPPRREALLRGLGNAVWRALKRGLVRTTAQLRRLLHELIAHLREAPEGVSASLRRACGYAGAIVLMGLRAIGALSTRSPIPDRPEVDPTEALHRKLEDLRRLYLQPWLSPEERQRIAEEGRRLRVELQI